MGWSILFKLGVWVMLVGIVVMVLGLIEIWKAVALSMALIVSGFALCILAAGKEQENARSKE